MQTPPISGFMPNERPLPAEPAAIGAPRLLWPSIEHTGAGVKSHDATHFPEESRVRDRRKECVRLRQCLRRIGGAIPDNAMTLVAFEDAVMEARRRLLVLDPYFDEVGVHALRGALECSEAVEVRILTARRGSETTRWRRNLEQHVNLNRTDGLEVAVQWRTWGGSFPFLHDRFAIVDDGLWHFGATVGGGHEGTNAASGPWPAYDARAIDFFNECWRTCHA